MAVETRACELRAEGRRLEGEAIVYADEAVFPWGRERVEPGAFLPLGDIILNRQHDRKTPLARTGGGGLTINDSPEALRIRAELPVGVQAADETLALVRAKILRGLSIEFHALSERFEADLRIIERAQLVGVGVVDSPSYPQSLVAARAEERAPGRLRTLRGSIPANKALECRCSPGDCREALFESGALDDAIPHNQQKDALAVLGEYANILGSRKKKTLRFWSDKKGGLEWALDIQNSPRGKALLESIDAADVIARPVIDTAAGASDFVLEAGRATYQKARIRALQFGATDASGGWTPVRFRRGRDDDMPAGAAGEPRRSRFWL